MRPISGLRLSIAVQVAIMVCLAGMLVGCTFDTRGAPKSVRQKVQATTAASPDRQISSVHGTRVTRVLFWTISQAYSHLFGGTKALRHDIASAVLTTASGQRFPKLEFVSYSTACPMQPRIANQLRRIMSQTIQPVLAAYPWRDIKLYIDFVGFDVNVNKNVYAVRAGRGISLTFYFQCDPGHLKRSVFSAFLTMFHEMSHAVARVAILDHAHLARPDAWSELFAQAGVDCVYRTLREDHDVLGLAKLVPEKSHAHSGGEPPGEKLSFKQQLHTCPAWQKSLLQHKPLPIMHETK